MNRLANWKSRDWRALICHILQQQAIDRNINNKMTQQLIVAINRGRDFAQKL